MSQPIVMSVKQVENKEHQNTLLSNLQHLWLSKKLLNLTFHFHGCDIQAHQLVLAAFSGQLCAAFVNAKKHAVLDMTGSGFTVRGLKELLNYLYFGKMYLDIKLCYEVLNIAKAFQIKKVVAICELYLSSFGPKTNETQPPKTVTIETCTPALDKVLITEINHGFEEKKIGSFKRKKKSKSERKKKMKECFPSDVVKCPEIQEDKTVLPKTLSVSDQVIIKPMKSSNQVSLLSSCKPETLEKSIFLPSGRQVMKSLLPATTIKHTISQPTETVDNSDTNFESFDPNTTIGNHSNYLPSFLTSSPVPVSLVSKSSFIAQWQNISSGIEQLKPAQMKVENIQGLILNEEYPKLSSQTMLCADNTKEKHLQDRLDESTAERLEYNMSDKLPITTHLNELTENNLILPDKIKVEPLEENDNIENATNELDLIPPGKIKIEPLEYDFPDTFSVTNASSSNLHIESKSKSLEDTHFSHGLSTSNVSNEPSKNGLIFPVDIKTELLEDNLSTELGTGTDLNKLCAKSSSNILIQPDEIKTEPLEEIGSSGSEQFSAVLNSQEKQWPSFQESTMEAYSNLMKKSENLRVSLVRLPRQANQAEISMNKLPDKIASSLQNDRNESNDIPETGGKDFVISEVISVSERETNVVNPGSSKSVDSTQTQLLLTKKDTQTSIWTHGLAQKFSRSTNIKRDKIHKKKIAMDASETVSGVDIIDPKAVFLRGSLKSIQASICCLFCEFIFQSKEDCEKHILKKHFRDHVIFEDDIMQVKKTDDLQNTGPLQYCCDYCNFMCPVKRFLYIHGLYSHGKYLIKSQVEPYCTDCNIFLGDGVTVESHGQCHVDHYVCALCGLRYLHSINIFRHLREDHLNLKANKELYYRQIKYKHKA